MDDIVVIPADDDLTEEAGWTKLSKIAFPVRWVDRKGPWTREDLEKIEMDEAEGSAWWWQHRAGRK